MADNTLLKTCSGSGSGSDSDSGSGFHLTLVHQRKALGLSSFPCMDSMSEYAVNLTEDVMILIGKEYRLRTLLVCWKDQCQISNWFLQKKEIT